MRTRPRGECAEAPRAVRGSGSGRRSCMPGSRPFGVTPAGEAGRPAGLPAPRHSGSARPPQQEAGACNAAHADRRHQPGVEARAGEAAGLGRDRCRGRGGRQDAVAGRLALGGLGGGRSLLRLGLHLTSTRGRLHRSGRGRRGRGRDGLHLRGHGGRRRRSGRRHGRGGRLLPTLVLLLAALVVLLAALVVLLVALVVLVALAALVVLVALLVLVALVVALVALLVLSPRLTLLALLANGRDRGRAARLSLLTRLLAGLFLV